MKHPWIKSRILKMINNYPHLKSRLRNIATGYVASDRQSIQYTKKNRFENLSPTAKRMYKKLEFAIREKR
jgi:hypothetical protein